MRLFFPCFIVFLGLLVGMLANIIAYDPIVLALLSLVLLGLFALVVAREH